MESTAIFEKPWNGSLRKHHSMEKLILTLLLISSYFFVSCVKNYSIKRQKETLETTLTTTEQPEVEFPVCVNNLLNKSEYHFEKYARGSCNQHIQLHSKTAHKNSCKLIQYTIKRVVSCFDALYPEQKVASDPYIENETRKSEKILHFVFMGDSRIRQHFYDFIRLIPDYDKKFKPVNPLLKKWANDIDFTSRLLRLRVSFFSRPLLNDNVTETLRSWTESHDNERPFWILLSITAHHMLQINGANFQLYQKRLTQIAPILGQLANVSKVVWLNQNPTVDYYDENTGHNTDVHSEKIHHYNEATRSILKNHPNVLIWDSSTPLVEEYVRSCTVYSQREAKTNTFSLKYFSCEDYIHTGNAALSQTTQLLFNDVCNKKNHKGKSRKRDHKSF